VLHETHVAVDDEAAGHRQIDAKEWMGWLAIGAVYLVCLVAWHLFRPSASTAQAVVLWVLTITFALLAGRYAALSGNACRQYVINRGDRHAVLRATSMDPDPEAGAFWERAPHDARQWRTYAVGSLVSLALVALLAATGGLDVLVALFAVVEFATAFVAGYLYRQTVVDSGVPPRFRALDVAVAADAVATEP
jgi:hypothetical protein